VSCDTGVGTLARPDPWRKLWQDFNAIFGLATETRRVWTPGLRQNGASTMRDGASENEREKIEHNQQNCPTGKSLPIYRTRVKPQNKKYFAFPEERNRAYHSHPVPVRGAYHDRHERGTGSGGR
jgi:hypothetical protein